MMTMMTQGARFAYFPSGWMGLLLTRELPRDGWAGWADGAACGKGRHWGRGYGEQGALRVSAYTVLGEAQTHCIFSTNQ